MGWALPLCCPFFCQAPDILILSSGLTFNGELQSHIELAVKLQRATDAGIAVLALPGELDCHVIIGTMSLYEEKKG